MASQAYGVKRLLRRQIAGDDWGACQDSAIRAGMP
ncbi:MAG: hypothetical protein JWP77_2736 [Polaromonas sp.]|jgi:hypothetical protein|nr:hypothetical protein [Polaromonas sp.]